MTTVYKGYQPSLDRFVLLKVLKPSFSTDVDLLRRFEQEARLLARISHPNVATVYACGREDERAYLVTEFVEGGDLRAALDEEGALPVERAVETALQAARGLRAAHDQGVLHRDLKPANILLAEGGRVKLTDFGMASLAGAGTDAELRGTPAYLAPELYRGQEPSAASDLFAFGATFYAMLSGRDAFGGPDTGAVADTVLHFDPMPSLAFHADPPSGITAILAALLAKDPAARYTGADELIEELEKYRKADRRRRAAARPSRSGRATSVEAGWRRYLHLEYAALLLVVAMGMMLGWGMSAQREIPEPAVVEVFPVGESRSDSLGSSSAERNSYAETTTDTLEREETMPEAKPEATVPETGFLRVASEPSSEVYVNGESVGATPISSALSLPPGRHQIVLKHSAFPDFKRAVYVRSGETAMVNASLWSTIGRLTVQATPWAFVYVDGQQKATTPLLEPIIIAPGRHTVILRHPSYSAWDTTFTVEAGESMSIVFDWKQR